jgi:Leucine-rich repeat (LRR) protein
LTLLLLSGIVHQIQGITVTCNYRFDENYQCKFRNINYANDSEPFKIIGEHLPGYDDTKVTHVEVKGSNFYSVPMEIFDKFPSLNLLYFDHANLKNLDKPFRNCQNLQFFSAMDNKVKYLPKVFDACKNLKVIYMRQNEISTVDADVFKELTVLYQVSLDGNKLEEIPKNLFETNLNMLFLSLSETQLRSILDVQFKQLKQLNWIYLHDNNLIDLGTAFEDLENLKYLYLHSNKIKKIQERNFRGLVSLKKLFLYGNQIVMLEPQSFKDLISLEVLELHNNQLEIIQPGTFVALDKLEQLTLDYNSLKKLFMNSFGILPNLNTLRINNNQIEQISSLFFENFHNLSQLRAADNKCVSRDFNISGVPTYNTSQIVLRMC